ncbi:Purine-nucleoside phosphorylase [Metamycoplasma auris 15026]|uniref:Uridine phosphorylase n=1 Tax=Metamycoplasma auris 15026 TaxID=1188233 RepID=N9TTD4_9BACT|nr:purine-nucleoside phosphorylase [Metamycoplasma auris]ENY69325.1 Purine-nucleoside phosphorylase [Metamycoplasma auris 15026]
MTPHINAKDNAFAKLVLMPGDPLRAKYIADTYLENAELVSNVRNMFMYTGYYQGNKISVCASGMGVPSMGIYSHELFAEYGVEAIVRIGSAGSLKADLKNYEIVLANSTYSQSTTFRDTVLKDSPTTNVVYPDKELNDLILKNAKELNMNVHLERIITEDAFYTYQTAQDRVDISGGAVCVDMEAYGLFTVAEKLGKKASTLLTISDNIVTHESTTSEERQNSFNEMMKLALSLAKDFQ